MSFSKCKLMSSGVLIRMLSIFFAARLSRLKQIKTSLVSKELYFLMRTSFIPRLTEKQVCIWSKILLWQNNIVLFLFDTI
jgi:hypothetical protein